MREGGRTGKPTRSKTGLPAPLPKRSRRDQALVNWLNRADENWLKFTVSEREGEEEALNIRFGEDKELGVARLARAFGVPSRAALGVLLTQLGGAAYIGGKTDSLNFFLPLLQEIAPKDGMEGMLAVQMVCVHNAAMEQLRRAALPEQAPEGQDAAINRAAKLLRVYATQMECLDARRGKSRVTRQKVVVKHVHVHEGGQAIVGAVAHGKPNGRGAGDADGI